MDEMKKNIVKLHPSGVVLEGNSETTILDTALSLGVSLNHGCKNGTCGVCRARVLAENGEIITEVLACQYYPTSDVILEIDYLPELDSIRCITSPAKVDSILQQTETIIVLSLRLPPQNAFKYLAGQYIDLTLQGVTRSYSIASAPVNDNKLELHFKRVIGGEMSDNIFSPVRKNQLLQIEGPKGTFFFRNNKMGPIIFLVTGTGFAPAKAIISELILQKKLDRPIYIYWGNRNSELFYDDAPLLWNKELSNVSVYLCLSKEESGWLGRRGHVQDCFLADGICLDQAEVYACGSIEMIESAKSLLIGAGLDRDGFYSDAFVAS